MRISRRERGFSLVEIMIVTAILLILAGLLMPVLSSARESGRSATCLSNLHQIALAELAYADANGGAPRSGDAFHTWERAIGLWKRDRLGLPAGLLHCPDYARVDGNDSNSGYAMNGCLQSAHSVPEPADSVMIAEVATAEYKLSDGSRRDLFPLVVDMPDSFQADGLFLQAGATAASPIGAWGALRHRGKAHYAMVDGHVATLAPDEFAMPIHDKLCRANAPEWRGPRDGPRFALLEW